MRINESNHITNNPYRKAASETPVPKNKTAQKKDELQISPEAKELQSAEKFQMDRQNKVENIKKQVENGTYELNPSKIAQSVINFFKGK